MDRKDWYGKIGSVRTDRKGSDELDRYGGIR